MRRSHHSSGDGLGNHQPVGISPILLGLAFVLLVAVALIQPRHVPARSSSQIREARRQ